MSEFRSSVIPGHRYRNAPAAIDWLCNVFGFERHAVYEGELGTIAHAELTLGGGMVMLGSAKTTILAVASNLRMRLAASKRASSISPSPTPPPPMLAP
jgi:uncharacterized glyoxalase superfamily protein PhnB